MFIATRSFTANLTRGEVHVQEGVTLVDDSDELRVRYPECFTKARAERPEVESATAAPGEKRAR